MNRKKAFLTAIVAGLVLIFVGTIAIFIVGTQLLRTVAENADQIKSEVLLPICQTDGDAQLNSERFTVEFRERNEFKDVTTDFQLFMPEVGSCAETFDYKGLVEMYRKKQSISVSVDNGIRKATYSFLYGERSSVTLKLVEVEDRWQIEGYLINKGA